MAGGVGHTGGLTNPRPWRGRCRAGYSNTGGPPLPRKRAPLQKSHMSTTSRYVYTESAYSVPASSFLPTHKTSSIEVTSPNLGQIWMCGSRFNAANCGKILNNFITTIRNLLIFILCLETEEIILILGL